MESCCIAQKAQLSARDDLEEEEGKVQQREWEGYEGPLEGEGLWKKWFPSE